jgi:hypothetical protein
MLGNDHFYNRTIRKIVVGFGTLFNDIQLIRYTRDMTTEVERLKVPLSYGAKEKYMTRLASDPDLTKSISTSVPRISFEMVGMSYDSSRKGVTTGRNFSVGANNSTLKSQYAPIPYNFDFNLSVYVRNTEDGAQIMEQILPFFTPDFTVTMDFISPMDQKYDMPIILNSVSTSTEYEGDMMSTRLILWDMTFTAKAYIWPPVKTSEMITKSTANTYMNFANTANGDIISANTYTQNSIISSVQTTPSPNTAGPDDEFGFAETFTSFGSTYQPDTTQYTSDNILLFADSTLITTDKA